VKSRKLLIFVILIIVVVVSALTFVYINSRSKDVKYITKIDPVVEKINPECSRTSRLDNKPQYDRALSLILQRIQESIDLDVGTDGETAFNSFPINLVNCIYIKEEDINDESGVEGYFSLDSNEIKNNFFPITVDKDYKEADDVVTALLIAHEMDHVQQFLIGTPMSSRNDCLRAEADAFVTQWEMFGSLSMEEMASVNARIKQNDSLHPQLQMLANMRELLQQYALPACGFMSRDCTKEVLRVQMFKVLFDDAYYKKQCEMQK